LLRGDSQPDGPLRDLVFPPDTSPNCVTADQLGRDEKKTLAISAIGTLLARLLPVPP